MKKLTFLLLLFPVSGALPAAAETPSAHERLRLRNTFKTPEEVVSYYCARDASGFVWSGLLDAERRAFTVWREPPQHDSFLIAKKYELLGAAAPISATEAQIQVRYDIVALGDAQGTRGPAPRNPLVVTFNLKKVDGLWKITRPDANEISPVVLESKFFPASAGAARSSLFRPSGALALVDGSR